MVVVVVMSDPFDDRRDAHSATDAQGDESALEVPSSVIAEDMAENNDTAGTEREAHGKYCSVDVDQLEQITQIFPPPEQDGGKGIVEVMLEHFIEAEAGYVKR